MVLALVKQGVPIKQIVRKTGHSRKLVRQVVRGERTDIFRLRESSLEPHLPWLDAQWDGGVRNATDLWRRLKRQGFRGSFVSSVSGLPAAGARRTWMQRTSNAFPPLAPSRA